MSVLIYVLLGIIYLICGIIVVWVISKICKNLEILEETLVVGMITIIFPLVIMLTLPWVIGKLTLLIIDKCSTFYIRHINR